jgi:predicted phosphodiesterase
MKLLIISDIHGNMPALRAVLDAESNADEILCLGDLVDYGPQPRECVEWAMANVPERRLIQGNHDWGLASAHDPKPAPPYRHLTSVTQEFSMGVIDDGLRKFLGELLPLRSFALGGAACVACHAAPSDPLFKYMRLNGGSGQVERELEIAGNPDLLIFGHTHWPIATHVGKAQLINPGSVGQPKDGNPSAAYATWVDGKVFLRRAAYNVDETARAYAATPIPKEDVDSLVEVLRSGGNLPAKALP